MKHPEFDASGYPSEKTLRAIRRWPAGGMEKLFAFIREAKWEEYGSWKQRGGRIVMATGGWSGNEALIDALQKNRAVNMICWQRSDRGGRYEFKIPSCCREKVSKSIR